MYAPSPDLAWPPSGAYHENIKHELRHVTFNTNSRLEVFSQSSQAEAGNLMMIDGPDGRQPIQKMKMAPPRIRILKQITIITISD